MLRNNPDWEGSGNYRQIEKAGGPSPQQAGKRS